MADMAEDKLTRSILVLVVSLSEIMKDALKLQNLRQDVGETGKWSRALIELDAALDQIRGDEGVTRVIEHLGRPFDKQVDRILNGVLNPEDSTIESRPHKVPSSTHAVGR